MCTVARKPKNSARSPNMRKIVPIRSSPVTTQSGCMRWEKTNWSIMTKIVLFQVMFARKVVIIICGYLKWFLVIFYSKQSFFSKVTHNCIGWLHNLMENQNIKYRVLREENEELRQNENQKQYHLEKIKELERRTENWRQRLRRGGKDLKKITFGSSEREESDGGGI